MEASVEFLVLAVVLMVVGVTIVVARNRRPSGIDAGIEDFEARRQALAPEKVREPEQRGRRTG